MWQLERRTIWLGLLSIGLLAVAAARADEPDVLHLRSGEQFSGFSRGPEEDLLRWRMPYGDDIWIPLDAIDWVEYAKPIVEPPKPKSELGEQPSDESEPGDDAAETDGDGRFAFFDRVTKRLEIGARFLDGNNDQDFVDTKLIIERDTGNRRIQFDVGGHYGQSAGNRSTNRWFANSTIDFVKEGKWILFVTSKNEYDEFENLDYRGTLAGGLGYRFVNEEHKRLITRIGPAVTHELFNDPFVRRTTPDLLLETETRWPFLDGIYFEHKATLNPSVDDLQVFRLISNTGLLFHLDNGDRWLLKLGLRLEHNSKPNLGRLKNDYTSSLVLVYSRK